MEYISLLKNRKSAMQDTAKSMEASKQQRESLNDTLKLMNYSSWGAKGLILTLAVIGVDWKKQVPFTKRQLPLTIGALAFTAICDYATSQLAWKKHQEVIVKYTGFRNGVYINPEKLKKMKMINERNMKTGNQINIQQDYFDDEKEATK